MLNNKPRLLALVIYITDYCNLRCQHCWISPRWVDDKKRYRIGVPLEEYIYFIEQALRLGLTHVRITGGEPFLRDDIYQLLEYLFARKLNIAIETNGTLIDRKVVDVVQKVNPFISISLDAAEPQVHDNLRGVRGSYDRTLQGIRMLLECKAKIEIIMALYRSNINQLEPLLALCQQLGVRTLKINPVVALGRASRLENMGMLLSIKELLNIESEIETRLSKKYNVEILPDITWPFLSLNKTRRQGIFSCPFNNILGILANGDISFCGLGYSEPSWIMGNVKDIDLEQLWLNHPLLDEARKKIPDKLEGVCAQCMIKRKCLGRCRAFAMAVYGSLSAPQPYCQKLYEEGLFPMTRLIKGEANLNYPKGGNNL